MNNLLPLLILLPLLVGIAITIWGERLGASIGKLSVALLVIFFAMSVLVAVPMVNDSPVSGTSSIQPRLLFSPEWLSFDFPFNIRGTATHWQLGLGGDGISAMMILLTGIVTCCVAIAATRQIVVRQHLYFGMLMIVQALLSGVFLAMDLLSFYIFFEAVLLPVILMIYLWGDDATAPRAARRFLLFTLAGSIPMVVGLIGLIMYAGQNGQPSTVMLPELASTIGRMDSYTSTQNLIALGDVVNNSKGGIAAAKTSREVPISESSNRFHWVLYTLLLGFGIKMAIVPLHSWLPTTYESAHPNSTALIASVVGKLGLYGIIRIVLPLMPMTMASGAQMLFGTLGAIAIVYGALVALAQTDPRRLFAYSSISHLGFITVGLMSFTDIGVQGAMLQMFNHGLIAAATFLLIASLELRYGRQQVSETYRGLATRSPALTSFFVFFLLASAGLPGLNSFVGEFMTLYGMFQLSVPLAIIATTGILFGAWYALRFVQQMFFGPNDDSRSAPADLHASERTALMTLASLCLLIGVVPMLAIGLFQKDADRILPYDAVKFTAQSVAQNNAN